MSNLSIKSVFGKDVRRVTVEQSLSSLSKKLAEVYQLEESSISLKYMDDEGDKVTMSTDMELQEFVSNGGKCLKVFVEGAQTPSETINSAPPASAPTAAAKDAKSELDELKRRAAAHPLFRSLFIDGPTSLADLQKGVTVPGDCGSDPTKIPDWMDPKRTAKGKLFFDKNVASIVMIWHCSLVIGFSIKNFLTVLEYTNESDTPEKALKRYMATGEKLALWHTGNIYDPTDKSYQAIAQVRGFHAAVRATISKDKPGTWLSAYDMASVQMAFMGSTTSYPKQFGIHTSDEEVDDYIFLWKAIGSQLGMDPNFNTAGVGGTVSLKIVKEFTDQVLLPGAYPPPDGYNKMCQAYIDGLNLLMPVAFFSIPSTMAITYWATGVVDPGPPLSEMDELRYWSLRLMLLLIGALPGFKSVLNWGIITLINSAPKSNDVICPMSGQVYRAGALQGPPCPSGKVAAAQTDALAPEEEKQLRKLTRAIWFFMLLLFCFMGGVAALPLLCLCWLASLVLPGGVGVGMGVGLIMGVGLARFLRRK